MVARFPRSWLGLAAVVALGAMVRCQHLGELSYDFDEAFCWKMTTFPASEIWARSALDNHPPLYFYVLWAWSRTIGDSPTALRSLSVVIGLATVVGAYLLVRQIGSGIRENSGEGDGPELARVPLRAPRDLPALAATALVALSPLQIDWSQRVRMYVLGAALAVVSCWLLLRALQASAPRWRYYFCYALAATALAYTHYFGLFILVGQFLYAVGCIVGERSLFRSTVHRPLRHTEGPHPSALGEEEWQQERNEFHFTIRHPSSLVSHRSGLLLAFGLVGLFWLPWAPNFLRHCQQVSHLFHTKPFEWNEVSKVCYQMFAVAWDDAPPSIRFARVVAVTCLLATMAMLVWGRGGLRLPALAVLATFDGAICASIADRNIIGSRYFVFVHVLLLCGVPALIAQIRWRAPRGLAMGVVVAASAWVCLAHSQRRDGHSRRPGMIAAMAYLADVRRPGETVVVSNPILQVAASAHAVEEEPVLVMGNCSSFPYFQGTAVMRADEYVSRGAVANCQAKRIWVIDAFDWAAPAWTVDLPNPWVDISEESFPEWMAEKCRIVVRCCVRRGNNQR